MLFREILAACDSGKLFICANRISDSCKPHGSLKSLLINNKYISNDKINVPGLQQWAPLCARSEHGNTYRSDYSNGLHCARVLNMAIYTDRNTAMGSNVRASWTWQYIQAGIQQWAPLCARSEHGNTYRPDYRNGLHCARVLNMAIHTGQTTAMGSTVRAFWTWQYIQTLHHLRFGHTVCHKYLTTASDLWSIRN